MIHPSYSELMQKVNKDVEAGEEPVINSRYSIVIATAKRARQIIAGAKPYVENSTGKPLSIAVDELYSGDVKILAETEEEGFDDLTEELFEEPIAESEVEFVVEETAEAAQEECTEE